MLHERILYGGVALDLHLVKKSKFSGESKFFRKTANFVIMLHERILGGSVALVRSI